MTNFKELPNYVIPEFLDNKKFIDSSWRYNEFPSVDHIISNFDIYLTIWIREFDFLVCVYDADLGYDKFEKVCISEQDCLSGIKDAIDYINSKQSKFEVETWTLCDGWINCWSDDNEVPLVFSSYDEAKKELGDFLFDQKETVEHGDMAEEYSEDDYRIVEVKGES